MWKGHEDDLFELYLSRDSKVCRVSSYFYATSNHLSKEAGGKAILFVLSSSSSENLISVKLGICSHVRRPVSRDRRILVMEVEVGIAVHLADNIFTTMLFVLQTGYRSLGF